MHARSAMVCEKCHESDQPQEDNEALTEEDRDDGGEEFLDASDNENFEEAPPNTDLNLEQMIENYFARVDDIHEQCIENRDAILDFDDLSSEDDESNQSDVLEEILREAREPLFHGSRSSRLQFSVILMSLCTLYSLSHHYLDELLTFLR